MMEFLRKYGWTGLALLAALGALLAAVSQGRRAEALSGQLTEARQEIRSLNERLTAAETALESVRAETGPQVTFADPKVAAESRMLTVDITVVMPEPSGMSNDFGFCRPGEDYRLAWAHQSFQRNADGRTYTAAVTIPLDLEAGLELRTEDDTVLYAADSMLDLLPLRLASGGAYWHYGREEQRFYQCDWSAVLEDPSGQETEALNGTFHVYRNGEQVFTGRETEEKYMLEADGEVVDSLRVACAPGDHMLLTYSCEDAFGLHYEFPVQELVALDWDDMRGYPVSHDPAVTWPE